VIAVSNGIGAIGVRQTGTAAGIATLESPIGSSKTVKPWTSF
jgi:hypothetical protein